jgi:hypothetical protein
MVFPNEIFISGKIHITMGRIFSKWQAPGDDQYLIIRDFYQI